ncbi:uncharacterized protein LOC141910536 [Tubulanus polymorphus]|uniref:uncharacterized protein LOC141910536 n=1 Tax=Tubulanus polymorphus TaxID=672921 RepID=UPI003DA47E6B
MTSSMSGGVAEAIIKTQISEPSGVALDHSGETLYWCDRKLSKIESYDIASKQRLILYRNSDAQPYGLALIENTLYFAEHLRRTIVKVDLPMDIPDAVPVAAATTTTTPTPATTTTTTTTAPPTPTPVTNDSNRTDSATTLPNSSNSTTLNRTETAESADLGQVDEDATKVKKSKIPKIPELDIGKLVMKEIKEFSSSLGIPSGVASYWHRAKFSRISVSGKGPCLQNSKCSHICIPQSQSSMQCACPDGMIMQADQKTCRKRVLKTKGNHLLFTVKSRDGSPGGDVCLLHLLTDKIYCIDIVPEALLARPGPMDYDSVTNRIYWVDNENGTFVTAKYDGTDPKTLKKTGKNATVLDMVVDPVDQLIYYTTEEDQAVMLYDIRHDEIGLYIETIDLPYALVINHVERYLYWTEWGNQSRMMRVKLGENSQEVVVSADLHRPRGMVVSYAKNTLYWCDGGKIEGIDLKTNTRKIIATDRRAEFTTLALDQTNIYATDYRSGFIKQIPHSKEGKLVTRGTSVSRLVSHVRFITENPFFMKARSIDGCRRFKQHESTIMTCFAQHAFTTCKPSCQPEYEFLPSDDVPEFLKCVGGKWTPEKRSPQCIRTDSGRGALVRGYLYFRNMLVNCSDPSDVKDFRRKTRYFLLSVFMKTAQLHPDVTVVVHEMECLDDVRKKRSLSSEKGKDAKMHFYVVATSDKQSPASLKQAMNEDMDRMLKGAHYGTMLFMNNRPTALFPWGSKINKAQTTCKSGYEMTMSGCIPCKRGYYFEMMTLVCTPCPVDTYQPGVASDKCLPCPELHTTNGTLGRHSSEACVNDVPFDEKDDVTRKEPINQPEVDYNLSAAKARRFRENQNANLHFIIGGTLCILLFIALLILIGFFVHKARSDQYTKRRMKSKKEMEAVTNLLHNQPPSFGSTKPRYKGNPKPASKSGLVQNGSLKHHKKVRPPRPLSDLSEPPLAEEEDWFLGENQTDI